MIGQNGTRVCKYNVKECVGFAQGCAIVVALDFPERAGGAKTPNINHGVFGKCLVDKSLPKT